METHILSTRYGINEGNLSSIAEDAKDYALFKGISKRSLELFKDARVPLTFCLVPSFFPEMYFDKVYNLQKHINKILLEVSNRKDILKECLSNTLEVDEFTRNIYKIYEAVENRDQITLGLIRSDYLLHCDSDGKIVGIKQVENNTIASSFGGVAPLLKDLHEFILERLGHQRFKDKLPLNESCFALAKGLLAAWEMYENKSAIILFVVEEETLNINDQRSLEYAILYFDSDVEILRCSFSELKKTVMLKENILYVNNKEVAVVYYRVGYVPNDYPFPEDWELRLTIERSNAIKCPSAGLQLAGTKRVQAYLSRPGVLENFVGKDISEELRKVFVGQYTLENGPDGDKAINMALENPENFVLKPEREGGGHNIYGTEIKIMLENIRSSQERNAYILMERINAPSATNCIIRHNEPPIITNVNSELGIYGVILGNKQRTYVNEFSGHLLRSKPTESDECGIVAGFGSLDSPYLE